MSRDDFERCTPSEFYETWRQWHDLTERDMQGEWERTRTLLFGFIQPYTKHGLTAHELLPFPWDKEENSSESHRLSRAEVMERYAAAKKRNGLK